MATVPEALEVWSPPTSPADALYEYVDGEWRETPRMGTFASLLASWLAGELNRVAGPAHIGIAMAEVLFRLPPKGIARRPDVAFVRYERWPYTEPLEEDPPAFEVVPNLTVEVNSPSNSADEIIDKVQDYFAAGVELVWVIYPRQRIVHVHQSLDHIHVLSGMKVLEAGNVLPGFRLPLPTLFAAGTRPA